MTTTGYNFKLDGTSQDPVTITITASERQQGKSVRDIARTKIAEMLGVKPNQITDVQPVGKDKK